MTNDGSHNPDEPIPVRADRCPKCGEVVLRPDGGRRHGRMPWSPWTCPRCGHEYVDWHLMARFEAVRDDGYSAGYRNGVDDDEADCIECASWFEDYYFRTRQEVEDADRACRSLQLELGDMLVERAKAFNALGRLAGFPGGDPGGDPTLSDMVGHVQQTMEKARAECDDLRRRLREAEGGLAEPRQAPLDKAFYELTVSQRNQAWREVEAMQERLEAASVRLASTMDNGASAGRDFLEIVEDVANELEWLRKRADDWQRQLHESEAQITALRTEMCDVVAERRRAEMLWELLDDIDTATDRTELQDGESCARFYAFVVERVKERHKILACYDGQTLTLPTDDQEPVRLLCRPHEYVGDPGMCFRCGAHEDSGEREQRMTLNELRKRLADAEDWVAGAKGGAVIAHQPNCGGHTKEAYQTHRERYLESAEHDGPYARGADCVAEAVQAAVDTAIERQKTECQGCHALDVEHGKAVRYREDYARARESLELSRQEVVTAEAVLREVLGSDGTEGMSLARLAAEVRQLVHNLRVAHAVDVASLRRVVEEMLSDADSDHVPGTPDGCAEVLRDHAEVLLSYLDEDRTEGETMNSRCTCPACGRPHSYLGCDRHGAALAARKETER